MGEGKEIGTPCMETSKDENGVERQIPGECVEGECVHVPDKSTCPNGHLTTFRTFPSCGRAGFHLTYTFKDWQFATSGETEESMGPDLMDASCIVNQRGLDNPEQFGVATVDYVNYHYRDTCVIGQSDHCLIKDFGEYNYLGMDINWQVQTKQQRWHIDHMTVELVPKLMCHGGDFGDKKLNLCRIELECSGKGRYPCGGDVVTCSTCADKPCPAGCVCEDMDDGSIHCNCATAEPTVDPVTSEPTMPPVTKEPTMPPVTKEPTMPPVTKEPTMPPVTSKPTNPPNPCLVNNGGCASDCTCVNTADPLDRCKCANPNCKYVVNGFVSHTQLNGDYATRDQKINNFNSYAMIGNVHYFAHGFKTHEWWFDDDLVDYEDADMPATFHVLAFINFPVDQDPFETGGTFQVQEIVNGVVQQPIQLTVREDCTSDPGPCGPVTGLFSTADLWSSSHGLVQFSGTSHPQERGNDPYNIGLIGDIHRDATEVSFQAEVTFTGTMAGIVAYASENSYVMCRLDSRDDPNGTPPPTGLSIIKSPNTFIVDGYTLFDQKPAAQEVTVRLKMTVHANGQVTCFRNGKHEETANTEIPRITGMYDGIRTGRFGFATFNAVATFRPLGCGKLNGIVPPEPPCEVRTHPSVSSESESTDSYSADSYSIDSADGADSYSIDGADSYSIDDAEKALGDDDDDDDDSDSDSNSNSNSVSSDSSGCASSDNDNDNSVSSDDDDNDDDNDTAKSVLESMYMQERDSALSTAEQISQKTATRALALLGFISVCVFGYSRIFAAKEYISINNQIPEEEEI